MEQSVKKDITPSCELFSLKMKEKILLQQIELLEKRNSNLEQECSSLRQELASITDTLNCYQDADKAQNLELIKLRTKENHGLLIEKDKDTALGQLAQAISEKLEPNKKIIETRNELLLSQKEIVATRENILLSEKEATTLKVKIKQYKQGLVYNSNHKLIKFLISPYDYFNDSKSKVSVLKFFCSKDQKLTNKQQEIELVVSQLFPKCEENLPKRSIYQLKKWLTLLFLRLFFCHTENANSHK